MLDSPYSQPSFFDDMPSSISIDKWQNTVNLISRIFNAPGAWIMQANTKGMEAIAASTVKEHGFPAGFHVAADVDIYCQQVIKTKQHLYVHNANKEGNWEHNPEYTQANFISYLGVPIQWPDGLMFGTLCVLDTKETSYPEEYIELMWQLKEIIDSDLKNLTLINKLKHQGITDELTGINNRRGFLEQSKGLMSLAQRNKLSLALIYFDINNLKLVNDTYGHEAGDSLIKSFSDALSQSIRKEDIIARPGGDEFCFLGINTDDYDFIVLESRVQSAFNELTKNDSRIINPTFSTGNKLFDHTNKFNIDKMLSEVDTLMYEDKQIKKKYYKLKN